MTFGSAFVWRRNRFLSARHCTLLVLGDESALFCDRSQKLFHLNHTAVLLWRALSEGASAEQAVELLVRLGHACEDARGHVEQTLLDWLRHGFIYPEDSLSSPLGGTAVASCALPVGTVALRIHGDLNTDLVNLQVSGFDPGFGDPVARHDIAAAPDGALFFRDGAPVGLRATEEISPQIKSMLANEIAERLDGGFLAHGAMLSRNGHRFLLSAPPGTGKSTLTLALSSCGFLYGGDDLVFVDAQGLAQGVCFPAAIKPSGWPLLSQRLPELETTPIHRRGDKKRVRYILPGARDHLGLRPIDSLIVLEREAGAKATASPLSALEALCAIVGSGWSRAHASSQKLIVGLSRTLVMGRHYKLTFDDLDEAVSLVSALTA